MRSSVRARGPAKAVLAVAACLSVAAVVGVGVASLPETHRATQDVWVEAFGDPRRTDRALIAAGVPTGALSRSAAAPLLPGGQPALAAVRRTVGRALDLRPAAVGRRVEVQDSDALSAFDYDKVLGRRLTFAAQGPSPDAAETLARQFAAVYSARRARLYRGYAAQVRDRQARIGAELEADRLQLLRTQSALPVPSSPKPLRDAVMAGVICALLFTLAGRVRRRARTS